MSRFPQSWNRNPIVEPQGVIPWHNRCAELPTGSVLAHGNGRSYSDVCLTSKGQLLLTRSLNKFIHFDRATGVLRCESGVTLQEILAIVVPCGWFLPVTPGTQFATIGGALANDVHGKNHHCAGSFGHHLRCFELLRSDGERMLCSPNNNAEWFAATLGGLGLTGLVTWVEIQLLAVDNPAMWVQSCRFANLNEFWQVNAHYESITPYTVAWVDCAAKGKRLGRGIMFAGRHAGAGIEPVAHKSKGKSIPVDPPISLINQLSLRSFNALYYRQPVKPQGFYQHYLPYFYPLDAIQQWNRIYGRKGFYQYQCVLPPDTAPEGIAELLQQIAASGQGSFLAVLKTFGTMPSLGMLSFPRPGATLALDFANLGEDTLSLLKRLDAVVSEHGGALYPAKDARMPAAMFQLSYPDWQQFAAYVDPAFCSDFWSRVSQ